MITGIFKPRRRIFHRRDQFHVVFRRIHRRQKTYRRPHAARRQRRATPRRRSACRRQACAVRGRAVRARIGAHRQPSCARHRQRPSGAIGSARHLLLLSLPAPTAATRSGRRNPIGESPGIRYRCRARSIHKPVCHSGPFLPIRCSGSTKPTGWSSPRSNTWRKRSRSSGSSSLLFERIHVDRQLALLAADIASGSS